MNKENGDRPAELGAGRKVLLVHNDVRSTLALQLREALEKENYHCAAFASGEEALAQCEPSLLGAAILSLDLEDFDAVALGRRLKQLAGERAFLPVVVIGDETKIATRFREFAGGCDDFMATPVSLAEFAVRVSALVERRDVHANLVKANAELEREQQRRRQLAALIVHDLRNPLAAIVGNLQLLEEVLPTDGGDPMIGQCLSDLSELSEQTLSMLSGLLDVEELEDGLMRADYDRVDVYGLVSRMPSFYKTATEARKVEMLVNSPMGLHADFDRQLIARILENLLDNAVRYAPRKGRVVLNVLVEGSDLVFEVGNNGPAIPVTERDRMFDRYYRLEARRKGARANRGLGLYFCRLAAEAHKGTIVATERPDLPACFVLRIPGSVTAAVAKAESIPANSAATAT